MQHKIHLPTATKSAVGKCWKKSFLCQMLPQESICLWRGVSQSVGRIIINFGRTCKEFHGINVVSGRNVHRTFFFGIYCLEFLGGTDTAVCYYIPHMYGFVKDGCSGVKVAVYPDTAVAHAGYAYNAGLDMCQARKSFFEVFSGYVHGLYAAGICKNIRQLFDILNVFADKRR